MIAPPVAGDAATATGMTLAEVQQQYPAMRAANVSAGAPFDAAMAHFREAMDQYIGVVHRLAPEFDAVLVRTQAAFDEAIQAQPPAYRAADRVHPGPHGHAVVARAFLRAVGYGDV